MSDDFLRGFDDDVPELGDEDPFAFVAEDEIPDDFVEEEGPSSSFVMLGGVLAVVFVAVMLGIVGIAVTSDEGDQEATFTAIAQTNVAIANNATQTAFAVQTAFAETIAAEDAFATQVVATSEAAFFGTLTAEAGTVMAWQEQTINAATQTASFKQTEIAFLLTPSVTPTVQPVLVQFLGPDGQPVGGVDFAIYLDDGTGFIQSDIRRQPESTPEPTPIAVEPTPGGEIPSGGLTQQIQSADDTVQLSLPANWVYDENTEDSTNNNIFVFADNPLTLGTLTADTATLQQSLLITQGLGGFVNITRISDFGIQEITDSFQTNYLLGLVEAAGATLVEPAALAEEALTTTYVGEFENGTTRGFISIVDLGDSLGVVVTYTTADGFEANRALLLSINESVWKDTSTAPDATPAPTDEPSVSEEGSSAAVTPDALRTAFLQIPGILGCPIVEIVPPQAGGATAVSAQCTVTPEARTRDTAETMRISAQPFFTADIDFFVLLQDGTTSTNYSRLATDADWTELDIVPAGGEDEGASGYKPNEVPAVPMAKEAALDPAGGVFRQGQTPTPTPTPGNLIFESEVGPDGQFEIPLLPPGSTYILTLNVVTLPFGTYTLNIGRTPVSFTLPTTPETETQRIQVLQSDGSTITVVIQLLGGGLPETPTGTEEVTPGVTQTEETPSGATLSPFQQTASAIASPVILPTELPRGGFFSDGDSASESLAFLAVLGAALVTVVVMVRRFRTAT